MGWWKADPEPEPVSSTKSSIPISISTSSSSSPTDAAAACPVDHKTREIWLQQAKSQSQTQNKSQKLQQPPSSSPIPSQVPKASSSTPILPSSQECSSDRIDQSTDLNNWNPAKQNESATALNSRTLSHDRTISSIPRALAPETFQTPTKPTPANSEAETGPHSSGNWIYPSESQFFQAVMRKQTSSNPADLVASISHIIPIHNAVNERAWTLIKAWEGSSSAKCGGPKLLSFHGLGAGAISPKARLKSLWGYTEPFDRHDWVVERCGGDTVDYVIDFYQGKQATGGKGDNANLSFYLDVRPKLNSFQGCKMRMERLVGLR